MPLDLILPTGERIGNESDQVPLPVNIKTSGGVSIDEIEYGYMGSKTSGDYKYFGFKENKGSRWKVMRQKTTDDSAWKYAYSTTEDPAKSWTAAWADPTALDYADPPNS